MDFSDALRHLRRGKAVHRHGWNGKGMFLFYVPAKEFAVEQGSALSNAVPIGSMQGMGHYLAMRAVDGTSVPWLCSQTDMLAEDWELKYPDEPSND